jgi:hypothetical protein
MERYRAMTADGLARWRGLDARIRLAVVAVAGLIVLALATNVAFAIVAVAIAGAAWYVAARLRLDPLRSIGVGAVAALLMLAAAHVVSPAPPSAALPAPATPAPVRSVSDIASLVAELDATSADAWVAVGDALPQDSATAAGVVAYERALLIDPANRRALLRLAAYFGSASQTLSDEAIAAYYTALGGGTPPPPIRLPSAG